MKGVQWFHPEVDSVQTFLAHNFITKLELNAGACLFDQYLAYVKKRIDKQILSHDHYLKFIEDTFLMGGRLDPSTDGRPDSRPAVRETIRIVHNHAGQVFPVGDLRNDFDFTQSPLPPLILTIPIVGLHQTNSARV
jgi:hypothetical protein